MPTYEYVCRDCGHHLEVVQSFRDDPLSTCGRCQGSLRKVFSAAGIIFKGSGYYVTDSRPKPASAGASADGGAEGKGAEEKGSSATASPTNKDTGKAAKSA
jgi:putative FmdB family regulatory protein